MQHPLSKSPTFKKKIGDFVACGRVIERKGGLQTGPLHTSPAKGICADFLFSTIVQQALFYRCFKFQFVVSLVGRLDHKPPQIPNGNLRKGRPSVGRPNFNSL